MRGPLVVKGLSSLKKPSVTTIWWSVSKDYTPFLFRYSDFLDIDYSHFSSTIFITVSPKLVQDVSPLTVRSQQRRNRNNVHIQCLFEFEHASVCRVIWVHPHRKILQSAKGRKGKENVWGDIKDEKQGTKERE